MWVEILELNDEDSYVPVAIEENKNVRTGGVYVLKKVPSLETRNCVSKTRLLNCTKT